MVLGVVLCKKLVFLKNSFDEFPFFVALQGFHRFIKTAFGVNNPTIDEKYCVLHKS